MLRMRTLTLKTFHFVLLLSICVPVIVQAAKPPSSRLYRLNILPILQSRCFSCHDSETQEGDIRLDNLGWGSAAGLSDVVTWQKTKQMLDKGSMPPKDADELT
ncbi:MAG: hypothetical protein NZ744_08855, partial [Pirellulaceae bacterium]|nr:hypothetical protein [Pirellulaceae bacterium]